ncbi:DUF2637 domain-containing protein [Williamsia sp. CHRR-6]|uniref:DUF2637 domain-containing protein n=1 Tax=Williamsia sp. CHRR-6 TaxID=2835871 RepID=UPI001BD97A36|nr:DUF2637 domain-containing protein [Williamsia sp. CHRR-6]MBT0568639.1 DUF2637 domain-containing protein [Williamsia sp. CHRR-6]
MLAAVVAAGIAVAAFVLSFAALWDVATRVWPSRHLSWLGPVVVDATILQATVSLVAVSSSTRVGERRYFWALLIGAASTSVAGNALHAVVPASQPLASWVAALIATIPPVFLLLSTHSLTLLIRRRPEPIGAAVVTASAVVEAGNAQAGTTNTAAMNPAPMAVGEGVAPTTTTSDGRQAAEVDVAPVLPASDARPFLEPARALRELHNFDTPTSRIAAILHHLHTNPDASHRELGTAGNVHHNTAAKIVNAYHETELVSR